MTQQLSGTACGLANASANRVDTGGHEFELRDADFDALRDLVKTETGICLGAEKRALIYTRLSRRVRALGLRNFCEYRARLETGDSVELGEFRDAVTTNLTSFFREPHHFDYLRNQVLRPLMTTPGSSRRLRIWSAGCSTGEEPYSIAMTVMETLGDLRHWDVRILATDLDSHVLATASSGSYAENRMGGLGAERRKRFFKSEGQGDAAVHTAIAPLRDMITFKPLNLMNELPMKGPLDAIFCRNVFIYFDKDTQGEILTRFSTKQQPGNLLFLGHSENVARITRSYSLVGQTIYRRAS